MRGLSGRRVYRFITGALCGLFLVTGCGAGGAPTQPSASALPRLQLNQGVDEGEPVELTVAVEFPARAASSGFATKVFPTGPDEIQTITVTATAGNYTLTFGANTTGNIAFNATAAAIQTALNGLASINSGGGSVSVSGPSAGVYTVVFNGGPLARTTQPQMTANNVSLTGGTVTTAITTTGFSSAVQSLKITLQNSPNSATNPLTAARTLTINNGTLTSCSMTAGSTCKLGPHASPVTSNVFTKLRPTTGYNIVVEGYSATNAGGIRVARLVVDNFSLASTSTVCTTAPAAFPNCVLSMTLNIIFPTGKVIF